MTFAAQMAQLPERLRRKAGVDIAAFIAAGVSVPEHALTDTIVPVFAGSTFVANACIREPALLAELFASSALTTSTTLLHTTARLQERLHTVTDEADLSTALRQFRRHEMVRIAWRDLASLADVQETLADLTDLAEAIVSAALDWLYAVHCQRFGTPRDAEGHAQSLIVLGMGKLGGGELNFSSDIDLIFAYPQPGQTDGARPISNEEFFRRLGQRLITALAAPTAEGFVFRVDMRLRPFGDAGPLAISFAAFEDYCQQHGRDWERYALIKARCIAGDRIAGEQLLEMLRPFVYRRYLDYNAFAALRSMKAMIAQEVIRKGRQRNIKLGPGGIREIEFIGQAFQLIYGGRDPALRERSILRVLDHLAAREHLPEPAVRALQAAYGFLRRVENRLQAFADQQTHDLPDPDDAEATARLAFTMGFTDWACFTHALTAHLDVVCAQFAQVFGIENTTEQPFSAIWQGDTTEAAALQVLAAQGFEEPAPVWARLQAFKQSVTYRTVESRGRERLDALLPQVLQQVTATIEPVVTFDRVLQLLETIARRSVYVSLLADRPNTLAQVVTLCAASGWIAHHLARFPLLLDDLLNPAVLYAPLDRDQLAEALDRQLARVSAQDAEEVLNVLRYFKQAQVLRVAAADVSGAIPLMVVSDQLTAIAEILLRKILALAWADLTAKFGAPQCVVEGQTRAAHLAIIAYGKLGGIELNYGSDLDIVFLHDSTGEQQFTDGAKTIDNATFFARLVQRVIYFLSTRTGAGDLYAVDTRLRPSGRAGLLVSSFEAFATYQQQDAWTWEHQALLRARIVAGPNTLAERFHAIRRAVLQRPRDAVALKEEVRTMRERMRAELDASTAAVCDLKQGRGGIADIEFVVQYYALQHAQHHPELLTFTDNIRQLDGLEQCRVLSVAHAATLRNAYRSLRRHIHRRTLQEQPAHVSIAAVHDERTAVMHLWRALME